MQQRLNSDGTTDGGLLGGTFICLFTAHRSPLQARQQCQRQKNDGKDATAATPDRKAFLCKRPRHAAMWQAGKRQAMTKIWYSPTKAIQY